MATKMNLYFGLVALLLPEVAFGIFNDGTGINTAHVDGTVGDTKLKAAMVASAATPQGVTDKTPLQVQIAMFEADSTLTHVGGPKNGDLVPYDTCHLLDTAQYVLASSMRVPITDPICDMSRLDTSTPYGTDVEKRTFYVSIPNFDATAATGACGIRVTGTDIEATVRCQRHDGFDYIYDAIYTLKYPLDAIGVRQADASLLVGPVPVINVARFWDIELKLYRALTLTFPANAPASADASGNYVEVTTGGTLSLGQTAFLELSLSLPAASGESVYFADNNISPVAAWMHTCTMTYTYATEGSPDPVPASGIEFINNKGCSTGSYAFWLGKADERFVLQFAQDASPTTNHWKRSPNVQWTDMFEVAFPAKITTGVADVTLTCMIGYCTAFDDPNCFSPINTLAAPPCTNRKKRSVTVDENVEMYQDDWPRTLTASFTIRNPDFDVETEVDVEAEKQMKECPAKAAFYALTTIFGILLLVVFAIGTGMFVRVRGFTSDKSSSVESFHNKAYN